MVRRDYESFTGLWLCVDKNVGGRIPACVGMLRQPRPWDDRKMIHFGECRR